MGKLVNIYFFAVDMVNEWVDFDGEYGHQCVDLFREFCKMVLGIDVKPRGNAINLYYKDFGKDWKRIVNTSDINQVPNPGDVIFWKGGTYGHIAIVMESYKGLNQVKVLEQNVGNGDGKGPDDYIKITTRTYKNIVGWYRNENFMIPQDQEDDKKDTKYTKIMERGQKKLKELGTNFQVFNKFDGDKPLSERETKELIQIAIDRLLIEAKNGSLI